MRFPISLCDTCSFRSSRENVVGPSLVPDSSANGSRTTRRVNGLRVQSSQIVSRSRSCRRSAPQTLQRFLLSPLPPPYVEKLDFEVPSEFEELGTSSVPRLLDTSLLAVASAFSAAAFSFAILSSSISSASASGISGMVSREDMLGLRERKLVGVDGIEEVELREDDGYDSLYFAGSIIGEECVDVGLLV